MKPNQSFVAILTLIVTAGINSVAIANATTSQEDAREQITQVNNPGWCFPPYRKCT